MLDLPSSLNEILKQASGKLQQAGLTGEAVELERLAEQVFQPCVVAVIGRVKAGKSTFINALLRDDLAKVGTTETTATINYFRYGIPSDPSRPVRCFWRSGQYSDVDLEFIDSLQGNSEETLRRAEGISHLEYFLPNPFLKHVTLVDTPGTGAVVDEHQNRTAGYLRLSQQLRQRHDEETQRIGESTDAVIYLVGAVARATDLTFLEEFRRATQGCSRALNAIGVMAKIDLSCEVMDRRLELARKIAVQLQDGLNTVIPVSAGLRRAVDRMLENDREGLKRQIVALRRIPPARLSKFLDNEELFLETEPADCPVSIDERKVLLGELPWMVFTTIARIASNPELDEEGVISELDQVAGFDQVRSTLEKHFFRRGQLLRCYRVVNDARRLLDEIKYRRLALLSRQSRIEAAQQERFLNFIRQANGDPQVAAELENFVVERLGRVHPPLLESVVHELDRELSRFYHRLENFNADFEALQQVEENPELFSPAETDELRRVLGLYGLELKNRLPEVEDWAAHLEERQQAWRQIGLVDRHPLRSRLADWLVARYGLMLDELFETTQL
jgi:hypothetical protein